MIDVFENERIKEEFINNEDESLAYYTTIGIVKDIIDVNEFWLTNCTAMNDMQEITYGQKLLSNCLWQGKFDNIINLLAIQNDEFLDGFKSDSERYIQDNCNDETREYIKSALMDMYLDNLENEKILTGILLMISCIPYDLTLPDGPIMAMGLLQNQSYAVRDRAIQAFERWNSRKGIRVLKSLRCDKRWLQRYVDKVITYLERDGID